MTSGERGGGGAGTKANRESAVAALGGAARRGSEPRRGPRARSPRRWLTPRRAVRKCGRETVPPRLFATRGGRHVNKTSPAV